jgi:hypothetical protein
MRKALWTAGALACVLCHRPGFAVDQRVGLCSDNAGVVRSLQSPIYQR